MAEAVASEYTTARTSKIRLKSKKRRRDEEDILSHTRQRPLPPHHDDASSRKRKRSIDSDLEDLNLYEVHPYRRPRHASPVDDPNLYDDTYLPNTRSSNFHGPHDDDHVDPNTAFKESLFDALAEDEGAAYWEGVYGQPVHTYSRPTKTSPTGELEQMDDDEYAAYVRMKMYEKTHQHLFEEKARRDEARKRKKEEEEQDRARNAERRERQAWEARVEDSLKRQERKGRHKRWTDAWEAYLQAWETLKVRRWDERPDGDDEEVKRRVRKLIPWPTVTRKWKDVSKEDTEDFFRHAREETDDDLLVALKAERVRWHPDKMMQRFGGTGIDAETMKTVTAVFQVIDRLWNDMRTKG